MLIKEWTRSIVNHLYWSVSLSADGGPDEIEEKWTSLDNHVQDAHKGHGSIFKKCAHKRLQIEIGKKIGFKDINYSIYGSDRLL